MSVTANVPANAPVVPTPRYARRRGTRGFAAFVVTLAGFVVLGVGLVVLPSTTLDRLVLSWAILLTVSFGIAHLVAAYGLIRGRAWSGRLTGYLAAIGIGVAVYGLLLTLTGLDPFGPTSRLPAAQAWAEGLGLLIWMIGMWTVAVRYALRAVAPVRTGTIGRVAASARATAAAA